MAWLNDSRPKSRVVRRDFVEQLHSFGGKDSNYGLVTRDAIHSEQRFPHVQTYEARSSDQGNGAAIRNLLLDPTHPINHTLGSVVSFAKVWSESKSSSPDAALFPGRVEHRRSRSVLDVCLASPVQDRTASEYA